MPNTLVSAREELSAKQDQLHAIFEKYPEMDMPADVAADIKARNTELSDLGKKVDELEEMDRIRQGNEAERKRMPVNLPGQPDPGGARPELKSIRQVLAESKEYAQFRHNNGGSARVTLPLFPGSEAKTLLALTDITPQAILRPGAIESAQEERTVADLMLDGSTDGNTLQYYEETTFTNAAAEVAEGGEKPEAALDFTLRTDIVEVIATWLPATRQLLSDLSWMESYIRGRLTFMVKRREELELLVGDGTSPNISGIHDRTGVQTQAKGGDPVPDAIYKAMTKIRAVAFSEPTGVVIHPNDWQDIRLLRTADGIYIFGSPTEPGPDRIWGLPVRQTTAETENTALVGAFRPHAQVFRRQDVEVLISTEHSDYFIKNKVAILAEERLGLAVYRPAAFCKVTGI